jgi:hypothetical protein
MEEGLSLCLQTRLALPAIERFWRGGVNGSLVEGKASVTTTTAQLSMTASMLEAQGLG